jgi:hypothetical protein
MRRCGCDDPGVKPGMSRDTLYAALFLGGYGWLMFGLGALIF